MAEFRKISGSRLMSFVDPITGKTIGSWYPKTPVPDVPTPSVPLTPKWEMLQPSWMPSTFSPSLLTPTPPPPPPLGPPRQRKPFYTEGGFLTGVGVGALVVVILTVLRQKKDSA